VTGITPFAVLFHANFDRISHQLQHVMSITCDSQYYNYVTD